MTGLGGPLLRAHARANLVLAVLVACCCALVAGSFTVLVATTTRRYAAGAVVADAEAAGAAVPVLGWTLALTLFTGAFLVASMTAFTIDARLPEIARLRLAGATGRQVARSVVAEVMGVGLLASLAGTALGWPAGRAISAVLAGAEFAPPGLDVTPLPWSPAVPVGAGLLVTFLGAQAAARRAGRTDPLVAVTGVVPARRAMTPARWVAAAAAVASLAVVSRTPVRSADDLFGVALGLSLASVAALACLAPVLVPAVARVVGAPLALRWPGAGLLAVEHTRYAVRRTAALALPVLLVVGLAGCLLTILATANAGPGSRSDADLVALGVPVPSGPALADVPGAASVTGLEVLEVTAVTSERDPDDAEEPEPWTLTAVDLAAAQDAGLVTVTDRAAGADRAAERPVASADARALPLGSTLTVLADDGARVVLTVTSLVARDPVIPGPVLIDPGLTGPWATRVDSAAALVLAPGADPAAARAALTRAVAPAEVLTGTALAERRTAAADRRNRDAVLAILGGGAAMACCSIVLGGLSGAADRRHELRVLVRSGATGRQVLGSALAETVLVLVVAAVLAVAVVAGVAWRLDALLLPDESPRVAAGLMAAALGTATVLAVGATLGGTAWQLRRIART